MNNHTGRKIDPQLRAFLEFNGYADLRSIDGVVCGLMKMFVTHGLFVGLNAMAYERRYCFEHRDDALVALQKWDGIEHPTGPWIKCKGLYQGRAVDMLGPNLF